MSLLRIVFPRWLPAAVLLISVLMTLLLMPGAPSSVPAPEPSQRAQALSPGTLPRYAKRDTVLQVGGHAVELRFPSAAARGCLLLLPGWDHSRSRWCSETAVCRQALAEGYVLILPEMGRSVYAHRYYPETRADLRRAPTLRWLSDTVLPMLQKRWQLLPPGGANFVLGLSTGARGALALLLQKPTWFRAGAALSGDFDQRLAPSDNLMQLTYGPMKQFPERWAGEENPGLRAAEGLQRPLYLGHGVKDPVVPVLHSDTLAAQLARAGRSVTYYRNDTATHTYGYWASEVPRVLGFFRSMLPAPESTR